MIIQRELCKGITCKSEGQYKSLWLGRVVHHSTQWPQEAEPSQWKDYFKKLKYLVNGLN